jgi:hypothetical protein
LQVEASGEPSFVVACHCAECQRRTGSVFGVGAYFPRAQIRASGVEKDYARDGQEARGLRFHFCPNCGTTVYWEADIRPDHIGVGVGTFVDPQFPAPIRSVWEETRHHWVSFEHGLQRFARQSAPKS